jgi:predicted AAA+ superfamily ATPase
MKEIAMETTSEIPDYPRGITFEQVWAAIQENNKGFNELGFKFDAVSTRGMRIHDEQGKVRAEVDIVLENNEYVIAVEVKSKPKVQDVEHHIRRLAIIREGWDKKHDTRKILGAIAGAVFGPDEKQATIDAGIYVLEQSGDTMKMELPEHFTPMVW